MKSKPLTILLTVFLLISLGVTTLLLLPYLASSYLLPKVLKNLPISTKEVTITQMTPRSLSGSLHFEDQQLAIASIPRFTLTFSMANLLKGRFDQLVLEGATLHLAVVDGRISLHGNFPPNKEKSHPPPQVLAFPLSLNRIHLKNCLLVVNTRSTVKEYLVFDAKTDLTLKTDKSNKYLLKKATGQLQSGGSLPLQADFTMEANENTMKVVLTSRLPSLSKAFQHLGHENSLYGKVELTATATFEATPLALKEFAMDLRATNFLFRQNKGIFFNRGAEHPLRFSLQGDTNRINFSLQNLSSAAPYAADFETKGILIKQDGRIQAQGKLLLSPSQSTTLTKNLSSQLTGSFSSVYTLNSKSWESTLTLHGKQDDALQLILPGLSLSSLPLHLSAKGDQKKTTVSVSGDDIVIKAADLGIKIPSIAFNAKLLKNNSKGRSTLELSVPDIFFSKQKTHLRGIAVTTELPHPSSPSHTSKGELKIDKIQAADLHFGSLKTTTDLSNEELHFSGTVKDSFLSDLQLLFSGHVKPPFTLNGEFSIPSVHVSSEILPYQFKIPAALNFEGKMEAAGKYSLVRGTPWASLNATLSDGSLTMDDKKLAISGININLSLPDLPEIRSNPGQALTIASFDYGSFHFTEGKIRYRLDDAKTLFIEKSRFNWCGGKIETGSLRISPESQEIDTTLYCDRLNFSEILTQFNVTGTEGEGSLNGKLPLSISKAGINVDGGFLFSTPGKQGTIKFENTAMLRENMPAMDTSGYLDYSLNALEDFSYNWTKLTFANKEDNLLLAMEIDGKPSSPLPYAFKGGKMQQTSSGSGLQYPVRLNVNFLFPLKEMFTYGQNFQSIMDKM